MRKFGKWLSFLRYAGGAGSKDLTKPNDTFRIDCEGSRYFWRILIYRGASIQTKLELENGRGIDPLFGRFFVLFAEYNEWAVSLSFDLWVEPPLLL